MSYINAVLTIDDIASDNTPSIVDYLSQKKIPAIMFAWGELVESHYDNAIYALKHGFIVGNHSYSHPHFSELTIEECIKEIEKNEELLNRLYKDAGVERKYRPFRFPYGDKGGDNKEAIQKYLSENGFDKVYDKDITFDKWKKEGHDKDIDTFWTFDFEEYLIRKDSSFTADDVINKTKNIEGGRHMFLIHAHDETEELVPGYFARFIDLMLDKGTTFIEPSFIG